MDKGKYYITTAIAYTSGTPHIGNSYEIVLADSIARFKRKDGYDVYFQTGTDEHGQKIELKAQEAGITPKEFVDGVAGKIRSICDSLNTSYDKFVRTTDGYHEKQVQKIFKKLYEQGDIYMGAYEGLYCTPCESFWTESQLVDGKCPDCGREVRPAKEEAYFFKMSKYADKLIAHINAHPEFIQPVSRKNEMMNNFLLPGLQDLCVSRTSFKWGIPVDFDDKHVVYVWLDALTNYITGIGYDAEGNCSGQYQKLWPADLHLIGKDIIRFHTIYWPVFLMALGEPLPKQIFGHPWLLQGDGKMSKSKGNVIYAEDLIGFFGVDAVRYFVLHEMPFENDGMITWDLMVERFNSDLANTLGNLVNRTISMSNKYFGGIVDTVIMRFIDILQAIPGILLAIAISACLGSGFVNTVIALSIGGIPMTVRLLRGSIMSVRKMEYLEAAQTINCSVPRLIVRHILPNSISPIIVSVTMGIGNTILMAASLSYIGLGVQPPTPEWGAMLSMSRSYLSTAPHMVYLPGLVIFVTVLAFNLFGDGLRDTLDPKIK